MENKPFARVEEVTTRDIRDWFIAAHEADVKEAVAAQEGWLSTRLIEWLKSSPRKPAQTAFTEGPLRQVAYEVERVVAAERERCAKIEGEKK